MGRAEQYSLILACNDGKCSRLFIGPFPRELAKWMFYK